MGRPAKALSGFNRTVGSNPTLSARNGRQLIAVAIVGASLFIALKPAGAACTPTYFVKRGDSWWGIAEKSDVSLGALLRANNAEQSTILKPKDTVCIPNSTPKSERAFSDAQIIQIIRDVWPDELEKRAIHIARRESKLNPRAVGIPNNCCYGLFQIYYHWHKGWLPKIGVTSARQLLDPTMNATAALEIYRRNNGWGPWE